MTDDNFSHSFFEEGSKRSQVGIDFQKTALEELRSLGAKAISVTAWLKSHDPHLADKQLWMLEKVWGDIVCKTKSGKLIFFECVTASGETTPFPTSKIANFSGSNKFYLFGWSDQGRSERHIVPSVPWNSYADKIEERVQRDNDVVIIVKRQQYASMRCGTNGLKKFCETNEII